MRSGGMKLPRVLDIGKENAEFQHLEVLKLNRTKRSQYGEVFVEGVACINALLRAKWRVIAVAHDRERALSSWGHTVISQANPDKILRLSTELMEKLSDRQDPSELLVIAQRKVRQIDELEIDAQSVVVIFDRPSNHGNLGSLIRSCDAFGATALVTTGHAVDIFDPAVMRASLGAFFAVPVIHCESPREIEAWILNAKKQVPGISVVGTAAEAETVVYQADLTGALVIILGNEATGMSKKLAEMVDKNLAIPMQGMVDSLNVACAGTVILYEVSRQRAIL
jgi:23S rRNA (uridine2479-2'-O)-methyltransferase